MTGVDADILAVFSCDYYSSNWDRQTNLSLECGQDSEMTIGIT